VQVDLHYTGIGAAVKSYSTEYVLDQPEEDLLEDNESPGVLFKQRGQLSGGDSDRWKWLVFPERGLKLI